MTVEHVLPAILSDGLTGGLKKPDSIVQEMLTGGRGSRTFSDNHLETYSGSLISFDATSEELEEFEAFLRHIQMDVEQFYLREPFVRDHDTVLCGPLANGTETAFILPFADLVSLYSVHSSGVYVDPSSGYTAHTASNIISSDDSANAVDSVGSVVNQGSGTVVTRQVGFGVSGRTCFKVDQAAVSWHGLRIVTIPVESSQLYRFRASVRGSGSFKVHILENDAGATETATTSAVAGDPSLWKEVYVDVTTTSTTTSVQLKVFRTEDTAATWFVGALGGHPGAYSRWFLPSLCPGVIEFASAPTARSRIICSGRGKVFRRVALDSSKLTWSLFSVGHAYPRTFSVTEVLELTT